MCKQHLNHAAGLVDAARRRERRPPDGDYGRGHFRVADDHALGRELQAAGVSRVARAIAQVWPVVDQRRLCGRRRRLQSPIRSNLSFRCTRSTLLATLVRWLCNQTVRLPSKGKYELHNVYAMIRAALPYLVVFLVCSHFFFILTVLR